MRAENRVHMVCRSYDGATITTSFAAFRWWWCRAPVVSSSRAGARIESQSDVTSDFSSQTGERDVPWSGVLRLPNCLAARSIGDLTRPQQHELRGAWMDRVIFEMFGDAQTFFFYSSGYMVDVRSGAPPAMIGR
jgi:hypothetical protein